MLKNYRPLLIQGLNLCSPGLRVKKIQLNQDTSGPKWTDHSHADHAQILICLLGTAHQRVEGEVFAARPGSVFVMQPGVRHRFEKSTARKPISLVIDLDLEQSSWPVHVCTHLPDADLAKVRAAAGKLFLIRDERAKEMQLMVGAAVFEILHTVLKCAGWLRPVNRYGDRRNLGMTRMVERAFERTDAGQGGGREATLSDIAAMTGYQQDHLNRAVRSECGLTLGQLRARLKLQKAQRVLGDKRKSIADVAKAVGMRDANYFSRWFRKQAGMTPSGWRRTSMKIEPL